VVSSCAPMCGLGSGSDCSPLAGIPVATLCARHHLPCTESEHDVPAPHSLPQSFFGDDSLVGHHIAALVCVFVCCGLLSFILCKLVNFVVPLRVSKVRGDRACGCWCCARDSWCAHALTRPIPIPAHSLYTAPTFAPPTHPHTMSRPCMLPLVDRVEYPGSHMRGYCCSSHPCVCTVYARCVRVVVQEAEDAGLDRAEHGESVLDRTEDDMSWVRQSSPLPPGAVVP
jgi:hypothetical protein